MLPLETEQTGCKLLPHSDPGGGEGFSRGNIKQQTQQQEVLQRKEEEASHIQNLNVEFKNLESRRKIGKFEKGNAEERSVCSRCQ